MMRHRRSNFTAETKREALARANGECECGRLRRHGVPGFSFAGCGVRLGPGNTFFEHINTDYHSSDNSLDNCAVLTKTCWKRKTDNYDKRVISKSKRQHDRHNGIRKPRSITQWRRMNGDAVYANRER